MAIGNKEKQGRGVKCYAINNREQRNADCAAPSLERLHKIGAKSVLLISPS